MYAAAISTMYIMIGGYTVTARISPNTLMAISGMSSFRYPAVASGSSLLSLFGLSSSWRRNQLQTVVTITIIQ